MSNAVTLRVDVQRDTMTSTVREAVAWVGNRLDDERGFVVAFISTPERWITCAVVDGELVHRDEVIDLASIFEMRLASSRGEFRWVSNGPSTEKELVGRGALVMLSLPTESESTVSALQRAYLCWGDEARKDTSAGIGFEWWTIGEASVGSIAIPLAPGQHSRPVQLDALELIDYDDFGNARVVDEICLGFAWTRDGEVELDG